MNGLAWSAPVLIRVMPVYQMSVVTTYGKIRSAAPRANMGMVTSDSSSRVPKVSTPRSLDSLEIFTQMSCANVSGANTASASTSRAAWGARGSASWVSSSTPSALKA